MTYIKKSQRYDLDKTISNISKLDVGKLNYLVTRLMLKYISENGESYKHYNDIIGVLECAKMELYRRRISAYENKKMNENLDMY